MREASVRFVRPSSNHGFASICDSQMATRQIDSSALALHVPCTHYGGRGVCAFACSACPMHPTNAHHIVCAARAWAVLHGAWGQNVRMGSTRHAACMECKCCAGSHPELAGPLSCLSWQIAIIPGLNPIFLAVYVCVRCGHDSYALA